MLYIDTQELSTGVSHRHLITVTRYLSTWDVYDVRVSSRDHWDGKLGAGAGNGAPATTAVRFRSLIAWKCTAHPIGSDSTYRPTAGS